MKTAQEHRDANRKRQAKYRERLASSPFTRVTVVIRETEENRAKLAEYVAKELS